MNKDLDKVQAGDFFKYSVNNYGIVILTSEGTRILISKNMQQTLDNHYSFCRKNFEFRRINRSQSHHYRPDNWETSFKEAKPLFPEEVELTLADIAKKFDIPVEQLRIKDKGVL